MEIQHKKSLNRVATACGLAIAVQGLNIPLSISLAIAVAIIFCAVALDNGTLKGAVESGAVSKQDIQREILSSVTFWGGLAVFVLLVVLI